MGREIWYTAPSASIYKYTLPTFRVFNLFDDKPMQITILRNFDINYIYSKLNKVVLKDCRIQWETLLLKLKFDEQLMGT